MYRYTVRLNGTGVNPFLTLGVTRNPFPQVAKAEHMALNNLLNRLAAEPIKDTDHLRQLLKGADPEFIEGCCQRFREGMMVEFVIEFPE